jgi:hypothetical protein
MKKFNIGNIILLFLICLIFISCSKDKPTENNSPATSLIGTWDLVTMKLYDVVVNPEDYSYAIIQIKFNDNGTAQILESDDEIYELTWVIDNDQMIINLVESDGTVVTTRADYTLESNTLTLILLSREEYIFSRA